MRSEMQMINTIVGIACADTRINAALLMGSRADPTVQKDIYRDYDVMFYVDDVKPFFNNISWIENNFGEILLMQTPDIMDDHSLSAETAKKFTFLIIFEDGVRLDLTVSGETPEGTCEPCTILVDKTGCTDGLCPDQCYYHVTVPTQDEFSDCCNEFWWCLNNVAKGLARDQLVYVLGMLNTVVRPQLDKVVSWYIGTITDFSVSTGKMGKNFKKYLPDSIYQRYLKSYAVADKQKLWSSVIEMCKLFSDLARTVAHDMELKYNSKEEDGLRIYLMNVKTGVYERSEQK